MANLGQTERTALTEERQAKKEKTTKKTLPAPKVLAMSKRLVPAFSKHDVSIFLSWIQKEHMLK